MILGFLKHQSMGFGTMNLSWLFVLKFVMYMFLFKGILGWEKIVNKFWFLSSYFIPYSLHLHDFLHYISLLSICELQNQLG
jgi:hypothetical protein